MKLLTRCFPCVQMRNPGMLLDVHVSEGATFTTPVRIQGVAAIFLLLAYTLGK